MAEYDMLNTDDNSLAMISINVNGRYEGWIKPIIEWLDDEERPGTYMSLWDWTSPEMTKMRFYFTELSVAVEFKVRWG